MNTGASTPPDVPEPRDRLQIRVLTSKIPMIKDWVAWPESKAPITS